MTDTPYDTLPRKGLLRLLKEKDDRLAVLESVLKEVQKFRVAWINQPGGLPAFYGLFTVLDYQDGPRPSQSAEYVKDMLDPVGDEEMDEEDLT